MTLKRMDNVLIVVDDLEATKAFFIALGLELEGESTVEGPLVGRLIGLEEVRATLVMLRTPPRPVSRGPQLVQGPRLVSRADFKAEQSLEPAGATMDFASGLQRYLHLLGLGAPDGGN